jgi:hypothetical protein
MGLKPGAFQLWIKGGFNVHRGGPTALEARNCASILTHTCDEERTRSWECNVKQ